MKYTSTRDATQVYTFEEALFSGYAPDGGLFVPTQLPDFFSSISKNALLKEWASLGYQDLATEILHPFIGEGEISKQDLGNLLERALSGFDVADDNKVPVIPLTKDDGKSIDCYVAELFHGPTYCFKDLGMRATVFLMGHFASKSNNEKPRKIVLTAATTGDTGPAAVQAVQDLNSSSLGIVVHYPGGQISDFQRQQMTTVQSERVAIVSFDGGGDDMDKPIKNIMMQKDNSDKDEEILVCGVNSYNIGRPLMQMVHFVWTYLRVVEDIEKRTQQRIDHENFELDIVIPTGAMGNIAGCVSKEEVPKRDKSPTVTYRLFALTFSARILLRFSVHGEKVWNSLWQSLRRSQRQRFHPQGILNRDCSKTKKGRLHETVSE